jgi:hypothetical protein
MNPLKSIAQPSFAERIGRMLARAWRGFLRREKDAREWLTAQGLPPIVAQALPLILRFAVLGVALYVAFWLAMLLVLAVMTAGSARNCNWNWMREEPEWKDGPVGYGLYTYDGFRIDLHVYDDD